MPIDREANVVFIHIPKTGGTTVEHLLGMRSEGAFFSPCPLPHLKPPFKVPQHFTVQDLEANLGSGFLAGAYKFAFVRNPWDRFVSEYEWRRRSWMQKDPGDDRAFFYGERQLSSLAAFTRVLELPPRERMDARGGLDSHVEPQSSFLRDAGGALAADFVGRYETFETDLRHVLAHLGRSVTAVPRMMASRRHSDYRVYYSPYTRAAVEAFYADDIAEFGYRF
jgi:sulfotransferase famil protein